MYGWSGGESRSQENELHPQAALLNQPWQIKKCPGSYTLAPVLVASGWVLKGSQPLQHVFVMTLSQMSYHLELPCDGIEIQAFLSH